MQDALRRLFTTSGLNPADLDELTEVCKTKYGLASKSATPLSAAHVPVAGNGRLSTVSVLSITHHNGVNALAPEQKVSFGPGLTTVLRRKRCRQVRLYARPQSRMPVASGRTCARQCSWRRRASEGHRDDQGERGRQGGGCRVDGRRTGVHGLGASERLRRPLRSDLFEGQDRCRVPAARGLQLHLRGGDAQPTERGFHSESHAHGRV